MGVIVHCPSLIVHNCGMPHDLSAFKILLLGHDNPAS